MPSPVCVIFDLDGTLIDSERLNNQALLDLLPGLDLRIDDMARRYGGWKLSAVLDDLSQKLDEDLPTDFEATYRARVAALFESQLQATPGTAALLQQHAFPRCIASSAPRQKIGHALKATGLQPFFAPAHLFSSYDIGSWKPSPHIFLHAAQAMGFAPVTAWSSKTAPPAWPPPTRRACVLCTTSLREAPSPCRRAIRVCAAWRSCHCFLARLPRQSRHERPAHDPHPPGSSRRRGRSLRTRARIHS